MYNIHFELFDTVYIICGCFAASVIFLFYIAKLKKQIKKLKRQYEKKSIGADDSDLKIKTLENKIKTLEVALDKNMKSQN